MSNNEPQKPAVLPALFAAKCPNCRKGSMFVNKSIFPLNKLLSMPDRCTVCNQKMELEPGFYFGTGYVSYGISVAFTMLLAVIFAFTWGFDYLDYSIFYFMGIDIFFLILLQPVIMRFSRVLYLYMFVKYGEGARMKSQ